jgi:hypothetical protein
LVDYADKIETEGVSQPVEFILTDPENNNLTFQQFVSASGIFLPDAVMQALGSEFSLYIYNDGGKTRTGLAVPVASADVLQKALVENEASLIKGLEPLFMSDQYSIENKAFHESTYNNATIRYVNITSPEDLSVDYTVYKGQWLVGTTEMTLRSIIDKMAQ